MSGAPSPPVRHDRIKRQIPLDAKPLTASRHPSPKIAPNSTSRQTRWVGPASLQADIWAASKIEGPRLW